MPLTRVCCPDSITTWKERPLRPWHEWQLPDFPDCIDLEEADEYADLVRRIAGDSENLAHRMFGHAQPIQQDTMEMECQLVTSGIPQGEPRALSAQEQQAHANQAKEWLLLLQIDTDDGPEGPGWIWGDCGRLYFWIRREDLRAGRFERCWTILQCT